MNLIPMAPVLPSSLTHPAMSFGNGVVEIGLLLPANQAAALLELAENRQESVAQVLRKLIERELTRSSH